MSYRSDAIVLEYLGDVATVAQRKLPPGARSRLVEQLRSQINSERERGPDTPEAVRRILTRMGSPEAVVGQEVRRNADLDDDDPADEEPTWRTGTSRHATVARQMGFRADSTPIRAVRGTETAPPQPVPPQAAADSGPLWARPRTETTVLPEEPDPSPDTGLVGAPAYPIGLAPVTEDDEDEAAAEAPAPPAPGILRGLGTRALVRELFSLLLLAGGASIRSAVLVILGLVVATTSLVWTDKDKRTATLTIPVVVVLAFLVGVWAHANGHLGDDVDGKTAGGTFFDLAPVMFQVSGAVAGVYLLVTLVRHRRG